MWGWIANLVGGPIVRGLLNAYKAKLAATNTRDKYATDLAIKDIEARIERTKARRDLGLAAMSHPVWWVAWALFVLPVGFYHAAIYSLSVLSIGPDQYAVLQVPPQQEEWGRLIVQNIFFAQAGSGIAGAVIQRFGKR